MCRCSFHNIFIFCLTLSHGQSCLSTLFFSGNKKKKTKNNNGNDPHNLFSSMWLSEIFYKEKKQKKWMILMILESQENTFLYKSLQSPTAIDLFWLLVFHFWFNWKHLYPKICANSQLDNKGPCIVTNI